jgi:sporulation protein YlmC with PRC-barrel domain
MRKKLLLALAALLCLSPLVLAQVPAPPVFVQKQDDGQFSSAKFRGMDVVDASGAKIGDISDIIFDHEKVRAYIVSFGGFLGMGTHDVGLPPDAFRLVKAKSGNNLQLNVTTSQIRDAPRFIYRRVQ